MLVDRQCFHGADDCSARRPRQRRSIDYGFDQTQETGAAGAAAIAGLKRGDPFDPIEEFTGEYRCIASDLRNANGGQSSGPLEIDRPWDSYADDQLGLMDHLRIDKFMVMGFCIGGPFIWNLLTRAPNRIVAAVLAQPSGSRPELRDLFYETNIKGWGSPLTARRPEVTMEMVEKFLTRMYRNNPDFVFTVMRDARAELRSEHVPVEGAQGADSSGGAADPFLPSGASAGFCVDGGGSLIRPRKA